METKWNAMSEDERFNMLRYNYPFDCLLTPEPFRKAARLEFAALPEITRNILSH